MFISNALEMGRVITPTFNDRPVIPFNMIDNSIDKKYTQRLVNVSKSVTGFTDDNNVKKSISVMVGTDRILYYPFDRSAIKDLMENDVFSGCVDFLTDAIGGHGYRLSKLDDKGTSKKLQAFLNKPSGKIGSTFDDYITDIVFSWVLTGEMYSRVKRIKDTLIVKAMKFSRMNIIPIEDENGNIPDADDVKFFTQSLSEESGIFSEGTLKKFNPYTGRYDNGDDRFSYDEIYHKRRVNVYSEVYGLPSYFSAVQYTIQADYINRYTTGYFQNAAQIGLLLTATGMKMPKKKTETAIGDSISQQAVGVQNAGRFVYLTSQNENTKFNVHETSKGYNGDYLKIKLADDESIATSFGISLTTIGKSGLTNKGSGSEDITALKKALETKVIPNQRKIESYVNDLIFEEFGEDVGFKLNSLKVNNDKDLSIIYGAMFDRGAVTVNEFREVQGLERKSNDECEGFDPDVLVVPSTRNNNKDVKFTEDGKIRTDSDLNMQSNDKGTKLNPK